MYSEGHGDTPAGDKSSTKSKDMGSIKFMHSSSAKAEVIDV